MALILGLTGGIGSGKSTVAALLAGMGAAVIDADAISRSVTAARGLAIPDIRTQFGPQFVTHDGALDRDAMRTLAFADASAKKRLEAIIHPLVGAEIARQTDAALGTGHACLVYDIPLLVESSHWRRRVDKVLVVDCSPTVQILRVQVRSGLTQAAVEGIIAAQASRANRALAADYVLCNDKISLGGLAQEVAQLWHWFGLSSPS